jgi:hypothetical protein
MSKFRIVDRSILKVKLTGKMCEDCKEFYCIDEFRTNNKNKDSHDTKCKKCRGKLDKEYNHNRRKKTITETMICTL